MCAKEIHPDKSEDVFQIRTPPQILNNLYSNFLEQQKYFFENIKYAKYIFLAKMFSPEEKLNFYLFLLNKPYFNFF